MASRAAAGGSGRRRAGLDGRRAAGRGAQQAAPCTKAQGTASQPGKPAQPGKAPVLPFTCPPGSFYDPIRGGECWICPPGFVRSPAPVEAPNACVAPPREEFHRVNRHNRATGILGTDCPRGQFWDGIDGHCYSCPPGFNRTAHPVRHERACSRMLGPQQHRAARVK